MPSRVTFAKSSANTPLKAAVPVSVAKVVPSYSLSSAVSPIMLSDLAATAFPEAAVVMFTLVAPALDSTMVCAL